MERIVIDHHIFNETPFLSDLHRRLAHIPGVQIHSSGEGQIAVEFEERDMLMEERLDLPRILADIEEGEEWVTRISRVPF